MADAQTLITITRPGGHIEWGSVGTKGEKEFVIQGNDLFVRDGSLHLLDLDNDGKPVTVEVDPEDVHIYRSDKDQTAYVRLNRVGDSATVCRPDAQKHGTISIQVFQLEKPWND